MAALFLLLTALCGILGVRRAWGDLLNLWQQLAWGLVLGWSVSTGLIYLLDLAAGRMVPLAVQGVTVAAGFGALALAGTERRSCRQGPESASDRRPLVVLLALLAPLFAYLWWTRMLAPHSDGLYTGGTTFNDIGLHIGIAYAFLSAANLPPVYSIFPPAPLQYPFLPDFLTAILLQFGLSPQLALTVTAVPMALAVAVLVYFFARHLVRSRAAALLGTFLFLFNGGYGLAYIWRDWQASGRPWWWFLKENLTDYTLLWDDSIYVSNVIIDLMLPQRASLFGLALAWMIFDCFLLAWQRWHDPEADQGPARRLLVAAGLLAGLLPWFHSFSLMAVGLVSGFLWLLRPRRDWLYFWLPAGLLAGPQMLWLIQHVAGPGFAGWRPGWLAPREPWRALYFWVMNLGTPLLLLGPAWQRTGEPWRRFYQAFVLLMAFSVLVKVSPHAYNNVKLIHYWLGVTCIIVAAWLVRLARRHPLTAGGLAVTCVASAAVALVSEQTKHWQLYDQHQLAAADFIREQTPPKARFLTAQSIDHPVFALTGRQIVLGYEGWITSHGYDVTQRSLDVRRMFLGGADARELLHRYGVTHVYLGPDETRDLQPNRPFFEAIGRRIYARDGIEIYAVPPVL